MNRLNFNAVAFLCCAVLAAAQDDEQKPGLESTCLIHVKASVFPSDSTEQYGKARVYVTLSTKEGNPIPDQQIQLTATCGIFSCRPRDIGDTSAIDSMIYSCDYTDKNGKVMVYLVNIPFNNQGCVTASCEYGVLSVKASGAFLITRRLVPKKTDIASARHRRPS